MDNTGRSQSAERVRKIIEDLERSDKRKKIKRLGIYIIALLVIVSVTTGYFLLQSKTQPETTAGIQIKSSADAQKALTEVTKDIQNSRETLNELKQTFGSTP